MSLPVALSDATHRLLDALPGASERPVWALVLATGWSTWRTQVELRVAHSAGLVSRVPGLEGHWRRTPPLPPWEEDPDRPPG